MRRGVALAGAALIALVGAGCGEDDPERKEAGGRTAAVDAPPGWRVVTNREAGFAVAVPRGWSARPRRAATVLRSSDRRVAITLAADRGAEGREREPDAYARDVLAVLPGFEGSAGAGSRRVPGSPYRTAVVDARGTLAASEGARMISIAALQVPDRVTYSAVVFRPIGGGGRRNERAVLRLLASLRGQPPG